MKAQSWRVMEPGFTPKDFTTVVRSLIPLQLELELSGSWNLEVMCMYVTWRHQLFSYTSNHRMKLVPGYMCLLPGYGTTSSRGRETLSHLDASCCDFVAHQDNKVERQVWAVIDVDAPSRTSTILMLVTGRNWLSLVDISDRASTVTEFIILNDLCWKMVKHCTSGCILKTGTQSRRDTLQSYWWDTMGARTAGLLERNLNEGSNFYRMGMCNVFPWGQSSDLASIFGLWLWCSGRQELLMESKVLCYFTSLCPMISRLVEH